MDGLQMKLVADTNIVFSLFKEDSATGRLVKKHNLELFSPAPLYKELDKYAPIICSKGKIPLESFKTVKRDILDVITLISVPRNWLARAEPLISHRSDTPFLALALGLNIPVWSNDEHFKEQSLAKVFKTSELIKHLGFSDSPRSNFSDSPEPPG